MSISSFSLHPSADIHLVLNPKPPLTPKLQLKVNGYDASTPNVQNLTTSCTYTISDSSIVTESNNGELNPVKEGRTFLTVSFIDVPTGNVQNLVARVWVHKSISEVWLGNNSASVNEGSANFVVSVYAKFDSGDVGDISGHGYVDIRSMDPSIAVIDLPSGRVAGIPQPQSPLLGSPPPITLRAMRGIYGQPDQDILLELKPALTTPREIVEPVWVKGSDPQRRNILFLAEGFDSTEKKKFEKLVKTIAKRMTKAKVHQPFKLLNKDYNIWMAFDASDENGVTIGTPTGKDPNNVLVPLSPAFNAQSPGMHSVFDLIQFFGLPTVPQSSLSLGTARAQLSASGFLPQQLDPGILQIWQAFTSQSILQTKNSSNGLIFSTRLGDVSSSAAPASADNSWYHKSFLNFNKDPRRMNPNRLFWFEDVLDYLGSLRTKRGSTDPNFNIGAKWGLHGPDQGLVVLLVNDSLSGAINLQGRGLGIKSVFVAIPISDRIFFMPIAPVPNSAVLDHVPNTSNSFTELIVGTTLHELGHSFFLGDEYEGKNSSANPIEIELSDNLISTQGLTFIGGIKWGQIKRALKSSGILNDAINVIGSNRIDLELFKGEGRKWKAGDTVNLRTRNINFLADIKLYPTFRNHKPFELSNLTVGSVSGDLVELIGKDIPPTRSFPKGSMIYIPKKHNGSDLTLILPGVDSFMVSNNTPLSSKSGFCNLPNTRAITTPPPVIADVILNNKRERLIGLYEGGGTHNCDVFRPTGNCKMRNEVIRNPSNRRVRHLHFCHVCKHTIVNEINPSKHSLLDQDYPGKPV